MYQQNRLPTIIDDSQNYSTTPEQRWALDEGEIYIEYWPELSRSDDNSWKIDSVEALVRWRHPQRGVLLPAAFIPMLEKSGLLAPLTDFVIVESVRQVKAWQLPGLNISVAVSLPPAVLSDATFPDRLVMLLDRHHLNYAQLELEISEDSIDYSSAELMKNLSRLRGNGFGLTVKEFGSIDSPLPQFHRWPRCNEVKIDPTLVMRIETSSAARATIEAIILLGHKLGMRVCAEGIETEYAFSFLADAGCDKLQGLLISPALSAIDLQNLALEWHGAAQAGSGGWVGSKSHDIRGVANRNATECAA